jgi:hypothetical protein
MTFHDFAFTNYPRASGSAQINIADRDQSARFEKAVAALISDLLGVGIAIAHSGFQHGGDSGPAGRQGRRFRIEAKRYSDGTKLDARALLAVERPGT